MHHLRFMSGYRLAVAALMLAAGCATTGRDGRRRDPVAGATGALLGRVQLAEGMLTELIDLAPGRSVRLQVTTEPASPGRGHRPSLLTIGRFSPILGSGFTRRKNIFFKSRLGAYGSDIFNVDGVPYHVNWKWEFPHPVTVLVSNLYTIEIHEWIPTTATP
jgi:hypothetical protein